MSTCSTVAPALLEGSHGIGHDHGDPVVDRVDAKIRAVRDVSGSTAG
jgi:hypothetical protein